MSHVRKQIRDAAQTLLTGLTTTGSNVFTNRINPIEQDRLPAITLAFESDNFSQTLSFNSPREIEREAILTVTGYARGNSIDDTIDDICEQVESAIANSNCFSGLVHDIRHDSTTIQFEQADKPYGTAEIRFRISYYINEEEPGIAR